MSVKNATILIETQKRPKSPKKGQILKKRLVSGYLFH